MSLNNQLKILYHYYQLYYEDCRLKEILMKYSHRI